MVKQSQILPSLLFPPTPMLGGGESHTARQVQSQKQEQYISGDSYREHYNSPGDFYQFNNVKQQKQQHQENKSWRSFHNGEESIIYIAES